MGRWGFPDDSVVKNLPAHTGDVGLIPGSERFPGEGNGNPLQCSLVAQLVKESACNLGDLCSMPGLGRSPGEGKYYPLQCCLENSTDRGAWRATLHGVAKESDTT